RLLRRRRRLRSSFNGGLILREYTGMHQQGTSPSCSLSLSVILASYTTCTTGLHCSIPPSFSRLFLHFAPTSSYNKSHVHNTPPSPFPALFSLPPFFPPISFLLVFCSVGLLSAPLLSGSDPSFTALLLTIGSPTAFATVSAQK